MDIFKRNEVVLFVLLMALVLIVFFRINKTSGMIREIIKPVEVIREITIAGSYKKDISGSKAEGWNITLKELPSGEFKVVDEKTDLPDGMKIDSVKTNSKVDWLSVFRVGIIAESSRTEEDVRTGGFVSLNVNIYKGIEVGLGTDLHGFGGTVGYRWRNLYGGLYIDYKGETVGGVLTVKPF